MSNNSSSNRGRELAAVLARAFPENPVHWVAEYVKVLQSEATILQNLAVADCNGEFQTDDDVRRFEKKVAVHRGNMTKGLGVNFPGLKFKFGGDPRGCVVKMHVPGFPGDSWDDEKPWGVW